MRTTTPEYASNGMMREGQIAIFEMMLQTARREREQGGMNDCRLTEEQCACEEKPDARCYDEGRRLRQHMKVYDTADERNEEKGVIDIVRILRMAWGASAVTVFLHGGNEMEEDLIIHKFHRSHGRDYTPNMRYLHAFIALPHAAPQKPLTILSASV